VSQEGIMSSIFRSSSSREKTLAEEMTTTMSTLLEDTILKNIQLKVRELVLMNLGGSIYNM
jgi:hypothetical protein